MNEQYKNLTATEMDFFKDKDWRDFHGYASDQEARQFLKA